MSSDSDSDPMDEWPDLLRSTAEQLKETAEAIERNDAEVLAEVERAHTLLHAADETVCPWDDGDCERRTGARYLRP